MDADQIGQEVAAKVRELLADAEERAAQIVSDAELEADRIRGRAESESEGQLALVRGALDELQSKLASTPGAALPPLAEVDPGPVTVPEPAPPSVPEPSPEPIPEPTPPPDEGTPPEPAAFSELTDAASGRSSDATAARLVAMNMALDGASREQIEARLAEEYALADAGAVVDDVLALAAK